MTLHGFYKLKSGFICIAVIVVLVFASGCKKDDGKNVQHSVVSDTAVSTNSYKNESDEKKEMIDSTTIESWSEIKDRELAEQVSKLHEMGCISDNPYGFTYYLDIEESGPFYSCAAETDNDNDIDFSFKVLFNTDTLTYRRTKTLTSTLIELIELQDKNSKHCCTEEFENVYSARIKLCYFKTDSIFFSYEIGEKEKMTIPDNGYIRYQSIPILLGNVKIGMTWEEFLNVPELKERCPDIKYLESEYIGFALTLKDVFFYFEKGILREMRWYFED